jgi:hypothetical protein
MTTEYAPLTTQARYKQILSELAELYERREHLKRERRAQEAPLAEAAFVAETLDEGPIVQILEGGRQESASPDPAEREQVRGKLVLIYGGRTDS